MKHKKIWKIPMTCEICPLDQELTWPVCARCGGAKHHDATNISEPVLDRLGDEYGLLVTSPNWWKIPDAPTFAEWIESIGWISPVPPPVKRCCLG